MIRERTRIVGLIVIDILIIKSEDFVGHNEIVEPVMDQAAFGAGTGNSGPRF